MFAAGPSQLWWVVEQAGCSFPAPVLLGKTSFCDQHVHEHAVGQVLMYWYLKGQKWDSVSCGILEQELVPGEVVWKDLAAGRNDPSSDAMGLQHSLSALALAVVQGGPLATLHGSEGQLKSRHKGSSLAVEQSKVGPEIMSEL